jgi:hypothetical protein
MLDNHELFRSKYRSVVLPRRGATRRLVQVSTNIHPGSHDYCLHMARWRNKVALRKRRQLQAGHRRSIEQEGDDSC